MPELNFDPFPVIETERLMLRKISIDDAEDIFNKEKKIKLYFVYINRLKTIPKTFKIKFKDSDRRLYQLDKNLNKKLKQTSNAKNRIIF